MLEGKFEFGRPSLSQNFSRAGADKAMKKFWKQGSDFSVHSSLSSVLIFDIQINKPRNTSIFFT